MSIEDMPVDTQESDELERAGGPVDALYAHWERHQWSALALDFSTDAATFAALDEADREGLIWMFANRFHAEFNVARLLAPFLLAAPDWGMQLLLATQVADEHRHAQVVLRIYDEVFGVPGGIDGARERADRDLDPVSKALLYDKLEQWVLPLEHQRDPDTFLKAVFVYHVLGEGVIARTGQYLAADQYARFEGFPGLTRGQQLVARDESRHIGIGVSYVRRCMQADPERTRALIGEIMAELLALADVLLETAKSSMEGLVQSGYGVDAEGFYATVMRLVDIRLRSVGFIEE